MRLKRNGPLVCATASATGPTRPATSLRWTGAKCRETARTAPLLNRPLNPSRPPAAQRGRARRHARPTTTRASGGASKGSRRPRRPRSPWERASKQRHASQQVERSTGQRETQTRATRAESSCCTMTTPTAARPPGRNGPTPAFGSLKNARRPTRRGRIDQTRSQTRPKTWSTRCGPTTAKKATTAPQRSKTWPKAWSTGRGPRETVQLTRAKSPKSWSKTGAPKPRR